MSFTSASFPIGCLVLRESLGPSLCSGVSTTPGGYGVETNTFFCVLDCEAPGHRIQASLRHHRNRSIYAGDGLIRKRRGDIHNVPDFFFNICFTVSWVM